MSANKSMKGRRIKWRIGQESKTNSGVVICVFHKDKRHQLLVSDQSGKTDTIEFHQITEAELTVDEKTTANQ